jgi:hypothetical protein
VSTGLALADRWVGDDPFDDPAMRGSPAVVLTPLLQRVSRQDLRAGNRDYDETSAFFDGAGAWIRSPVGLGFHVAAYAHQPELRNEESAFTQGEPGGPVAPATIRTRTRAREVRAGVAVSWTAGSFAAGAAPEWTYRDDSYTAIETSGDPGAGTRELQFSGSGLGGQAGASWAMPAERLRGLRVGLGARYLPALELDGMLTEDLIAGSSETAIAIERESGWEGGLSAEARLTPAFRVIAGGGGRTRQAWSGLGVVSGRRTEWSLGGEFHDARDPWSLRFGIGGESHEGSPEPRAGRVAIGFGWSWGDVRVDAGALRRSLERPGSPTSFDDRVVGSVTVAL